MTEYLPIPAASTSASLRLRCAQPSSIRRRGQQGVSLIEVLVAIVILSIGLLGLALLQLKGTAFTKTSGTRTSAFVQARSIADAMRANPIAALAPATTAASPPCPYCTTSGIPSVASVCPASTSSSGGAGGVAAGIARCDLARWGARLTAVLPAPASSGASVGSIQWDSGLGAYHITTSWSGMDLDSASSGDGSFSLTYVP